mgnify:CR=1 FL=1
MVESSLHLYTVIFLLVLVAFVASVIYLSIRPKLRLLLIPLIPAGGFVILVMGVAGVAKLRTHSYDGHAKTKSELASAREIVREQLSVLPDGVRDIYYSVYSYPPASVRATFHFPEAEFKDWMEDRDLIRISGKDWSVLPPEHDPDQDESIDEGYYWWGRLEKPLSLEDSRLEITVMYDSEKKKVYYRHSEIRREVEESGTQAENSGNRIHQGSGAGRKRDDSGNEEGNDAG